MWRSMVDIQSTAAEIRQGKKRKKSQGKNIMVCPITYSATITNKRAKQYNLVWLCMRLSAIKSITKLWTVTIDWVELMHCFHIAAIWCCAKNTPCFEIKSSQFCDAITLTYVINVDHFGRNDSEKVSNEKMLYFPPHLRTDENWLM